MEKIIVEMIFFVWKCAYMMLPSVFSNMAPVLFRKIRFLDCPLDFGRKFRGKPLFGSHKTFRGFFFGTLLAILVSYVQRVVYSSVPFFARSSLIDYTQYNFVLLGFLLGFGALLGDLIKSFFKRRFGIRPGKRWFPWDQIDFMIGGLLLLSFIYVPPWQAILALLIVTPALHVFFKHLGYYLKINKAKW